MSMLCGGNMSTTLILAGGVLILPRVELRAFRIRCIGPYMNVYFIV